MEALSEKYVRYMQGRQIESQNVQMTIIHDFTFSQYLGCLDEWLRRMHDEGFQQQSARRREDEN